MDISKQSDELDYSKLSIDRFLKKLAGKSPVPGGGGASSLCLAIGTSLLEMVTRYSIGKDEETDSSLLDFRKMLKDTRKIQLINVEIDAILYKQLEKARKEKEDISAASLDACYAPIDNIKMCNMVLEILVLLFPMLNKNLLSDLTVALDLYRAGISSSWALIEANRDQIEGEEELFEAAEGVVEDCYLYIETIKNEY